MIRQIPAVRGPVCGPFAATLATPDTPFIVVKNMAHRLTAHRSRWKGRVTMNIFESLLNELGVTYQRRYCEGGMLKDFVKRLEPDRHYILRRRGHIFTVANGMYYDQGRPQGMPVDTCPDAKKIVVECYEVDRTKPAPLFDADAE